MKTEHNVHIVFYSSERKKLNTFAVCHAKIQTIAQWYCPRHGCVNFCEPTVRFSVI